MISKDFYNEVHSAHQNASKAKVDNERAAIMLAIKNNINHGVLVVGPLSNQVKKELQEAGFRVEKKAEPRYSADEYVISWS